MFLSRTFLGVAMKQGDDQFRVELPSGLIKRFKAACKNHTPKVGFKAVTLMLLEEWTVAQERGQQPSIPERKPLSWKGPKGSLNTTQTGQDGKADTHAPPKRHLK